MAYSDFTLEEVFDRFGLSECDRVLFGAIDPLEPSAWLAESLRLGQDYALLGATEKARSEFIVAPILLELERHFKDRLAIHSGKTLEGSRALGLNGECDFILSRGPMSRTIQAPIFAIIEAKKQDIEVVLGQCVAQLVGAKLFNDKKQQAATGDLGRPIDRLYGCVTTGRDWQFLCLENTVVTFDRTVYSLSLHLGTILGIFKTTLSELL